MYAEEVERILKQKVQSTLSLGRYLGKGGMAEVYEVLGMGQEAVLKVVSVDQLLSKMEGSYKSYDFYYEHIVRYLRQEIHFLMKMRDCKYITRLIDSCEICTGKVGRANLFFMFEEKYQCLDDFVRTQNLTEGLLIQIAIDVLKALEALEERKILHRDIKPGNIFIKWVEGSPRFILGDFGLARELTFQYSKVTPHGTRAFGAPEVLNGRELVGFNSDIFSLGASLYYILTQGECPIRFYKQGGKPRLQQGSAAFQNVILKAIEWEPTARYLHAVDMRRELERLPVVNNVNRIFFNVYVYLAKKALMEDKKNLAEAYAVEGFQKFRESGRRTPNKEELACFRIIIYIKMSLDKQYRMLKSEEVLMLKMMAESEDAVAQYLYGLYFYDKGEEKEGLFYMKKSAENGSEIGGYTYGRMLCQGYRKIQGNMQKGIGYLESAAKKGYIPAIRYLKRIQKKGREGYCPNEEIAQLLNTEISNYEQEKLLYAIPFI
ncbi:protein kinase [Roseburia hominis]